MPTRTRRTKTRILAEGEEEEAEQPRAPEPIEDEDFDEDTLSLAALESKLKDGVLTTFDEIAEAYKGLRQLQDERLTLIQGNERVPEALDRRYQSARSSMVELMQQVQLNQTRVENLVQQLFDMNKLLQSLEGKLLRLAVSSRVARESFIQHYVGRELDPEWLDRVARLKDKGWGDFTGRHYEEIQSLRADIAVDRGRDRPADRRVPPDREPRPAWREGGERRQEGDG